MDHEFKSGQRVLLIGDSITDAGRRQDEEGLGNGYVRLLRNLCTVLHPDLQLEWVNRGISGDTVRHLHERWQTDVLDLQPDWLSISIGVNDVWRQLDKKAPGVDIETYEKLYREILDQAKEKTQARLILMEPSVLGEDADSEGNKLLQPYVACVQRLAQEYDAILVPIHRACLAYLEQRKEPALTSDGVHLVGPGMALFATEWLKATGLWS